jgi:hypothetical protein
MAGVATASGRPPRGVATEDRVCAGSKPNGEPCKRIVGQSQTLCYAHDPEHASRRSVNASKAGKSKPGSRVRELDRLLAQLFTDVREGLVDKSVGAVLTQIVYGRTRLIEVERRVHEVEAYEERLQQLEAAVAQQRLRGGRRP